MTASMSTEPIYDRILESDVLRYWRQLEPLPCDLRLYGNTALALYLDHRRSTDFCFATPSPVVDIDFVASLPFLKGAHLHGGPGMVDAIVKINHRDIIITFMECGKLTPYPIQDPMTASNGVAVAHPVDLVIAKLEACINQGTQRDYEDIVAAFIAWPEWVNTAIHSVPARPVATVGCSLAAPPTEVESELNPEIRQQLHLLARAIGCTERGIH